MKFRPTEVKISVHSSYGDVDPSARRVVDSLLVDGMIASAESWAETKSTNSRALEWLGGSHEVLASQFPRLIIADHQSAGRGRQGRSWLSLADSLACSLIVFNTSELLPLAAGVAVAQTIESLVGRQSVGLKWPNDVWLDERKVSGILIERGGTNPHASVIGVGVNIRHAPSLDATDSRNQPTSILVSTGRHLSRAEVLEELIVHLVEQSTLAIDHPEEVLRRFRARCRLTNRLVRMQSNAGPVTGLCIGVDDSGALMLRTEKGVTHCRSGEIHFVRPNN